MRLPTYVHVSKKTKKALNLNEYRNLHHHHLNNQKKTFHDEVKKLLDHIPRATKISIHYEIFAPRNGRLDTMNVVSVLDKYFSDTLVEAEKIPDDDYEHIVGVSSSFGGVRLMDGHAIATITVHEKESAKMRILLEEYEVVGALMSELTEDQIQEALAKYVKNNIGVIVSGIEITTDEDDGSVSVEILTGDAPAPKPKNKGGRPRGSKNKKPAPVAATAASTKKEVKDAAETPEDGGDGSGDGDGSTGTDASAEDSAKPETKAETKPVEEKAEAPAEKTTGKNLFADEDSQSSGSADSGEEAEDPAPVKKKKPSIFDA